MAGYTRSVVKRRPLKLAFVALLLCGFGALPAATADGLSAPREPVARLPSSLIEVPPSVSNVLIADASAAELVRFSNDSDGLAERDRRYMSVGRNGVGKQRAWDRKTPLGVYFLTEELDTSKLAAKYGEAAFVLDYPNAWDRYNERTGDGIWLHGVDPKSPDRPRLDTDGCLALRNEALLDLAQDLELHDTPVIISREIDWVSASELAETRRSFRAALERWRDSVERGDLYRYLELYAEDFSARGLSKAEWASFKLGAFGTRPLSAAEIDDVLLLADPEHSGLYLSRFTLKTAANDGAVEIRKRLYWRRDLDRWRIVSEDAG